MCFFLVCWAAGAFLNGWVGGVGGGGGGGGGGRLAPLRNKI